VGPDPDPNGAYKHFAIDLFGMVVHSVVAARVVTLAKKIGGQGTVRGHAEPAAAPDGGACRISEMRGSPNPAGR
jgi:hypothetical protein